MYATADLRRILVGVARQTKPVGGRGNQFYPRNIFIGADLVATGATGRDRGMDRFPLGLVLVALQAGGRVGFGIERNRVLGG